MPEKPEPSAAAGKPAGLPPELARLAEAVRAIERNEVAPAPRSVPRPAPASAPEPTAAPPAADRPRPVAAPMALPDKPVEAARVVLARGGAPEALAEAAVGTLGERAGELLGGDPWLILGLPGVRPDQADGFARALLGDACGPGDPRRGPAVTGWLLARAADAGHTALEWSVLSAALAKQTVPDPEETLRSAVEDGRLMVFRDERAPEAGSRPSRTDDEDEDEAPADILLALDRYALAEESLADGLARVLNSPVDPSAPEEGAAGTAQDGAGAQDGAASEGAGASGAGGAGAGGAADTGDGRAGTRRMDWEAAAAAAPSPSAAALIRAVADSALVAHTGGEAARAEPAALVAAARAAGLRAYAAAHTEDGRRRLARALGPDGDGAAVTVDGLLSGTQGPGRDGDGTLALDLLAVLDAPQLDVERAATLVETVPDGARLVLSGDPAVLWSAGPGRAFADLLAAKACPLVVSRTPDPGPVGELVSGIGIGELAPVEAPDKEVVIVPVRDPREAVHRAVQLMADSIPRAIGVPAEQTVAVTLAHGGPVGTRALNAALKERLNPGPGRFGGFDPGDRVVLNAEPDASGTVPGTPPAFGTVVSGDPAGLRLDCGGTQLVLAPERVTGSLRHGWAVTAHQAAGTRWPAVVVVVPGETPAAAPLTRSWAYTAFSRAERHLSVVQGAEQELHRAVSERPAKDRTTRLRTVLREQAAQV
ncbi:ATP-binding domain-containing protein [Streptantibioticus silvisoli]|uniref:ATP-binding domain-containing protein n=1 Tax=Streptantibioticus silvisoli TaxID=2705255 RepID=UPI0035582CA0